MALISLSVWRSMHWKVTAIVVSMDHNYFTYLTDTSTIRLHYCNHYLLYCIIVDERSSCINNQLLLNHFCIKYAADITTYVSINDHILFILEPFHSYSAWWEVFTFRIGIWNIEYNNIWNMRGPKGIDKTILRKVAILGVVAVYVRCKLPLQRMPVVLIQH